MASPVVPSILAQAPPATQNGAPSVLSPVMILVLCAVAGVGTVLLLPSRREVAVRKIGGAILLAAGLIFAALLVRAVHGLQRDSGQQGGMSIYFWIFSAIAIIGAIRVITHPRPVYSALYFILTVLASAGLFILLWAEFMAAALVVIYAGAILVTYVFVIMLASQTSVAKENGDVRDQGLAEYDRVSREPVVAGAVGFAMMGILLFVIFDKAPAGGVMISIAPVGGARQPGSVQAIGDYLFTNQLVNLELAGLILTISMVGAILIARRRVLAPAAREPAPAEVMVAPATPIDDNPHSIPVYGTENPRAKAYPEA
jgi:NADH-quinone oxidoreductase subunit J